MIGADVVADLHLIQRQGLPVAIALDHDLRRGEFEQETEAVQAIFFGAVFEVFAERDKADNHHPYLEVDLSAVCETMFAVRGKEEHGGGIGVGSDGTDADQYVHIGQPALNAGPSAFVERHGEPQLHDTGECKLHIRRNHPVIPPDEHPRHADKEGDVDGKEQPQPPADMRFWCGLG